MSNNKKEGENFHRSLSRKELQSLCKKYGLPARKSTSEMADSLFSYFQKNDLHWKSSSKSTNVMQEVLFHPSSLSTLHPKAPLNLTRNLIKDNCPREECNKRNRNITHNELETRFGLSSCNKEVFGGSIDYFQGGLQSLFLSQSAGSGVINKDSLSNLVVEGAARCCCGNLNIGVCPIENTSPAIRNYTKVPAFEFYVSSEEGIKLSVDLNSSPSDWIKKYNNQISLCNDVGNAKSQSLHREFGCYGENNKQVSSYAVSLDPGEINDDHAQAEPSPSWSLEKNDIGIDILDAGKKSLSLSPARPCSLVHVRGSDCLEEDQGPFSSKPSSDAQKQLIPNGESWSKLGSTASSDVQKQIIANTESCIKNGCSATATIDSDVIDTKTEKTACNFVFSSISDGSVDLIPVERNSKHDDEVCGNSNVQNCSNLENNFAMHPGCMASSTEMQLSEARNCYKDTLCSPNENGEFLDLDDSKCNTGTEHAALATSSENEHCGSHLPPFSEEQEWSNTANGRESSVCSQVDNSDEKTYLKSENLESNKEFQKKRSFTDSEGQDSYSKYDAKVSRSMKHSVGEVFPRRSMRLVSK